MFAKQLVGVSKSRGGSNPPNSAKVYGEVLELANRLRWKRSGLIAHARSERVLSANFDGVTGVAETRQFVALKFWVQLPGNSPISSLHRDMNVV